jgi:hypothetical protein
MHWSRADVPGTFKVPGTCSPSLTIQQIRLDLRWEFGLVGKVFLNKFYIFVGGAKIRADEIKIACHPSVGSNPILDIEKKVLFGRCYRPGFDRIGVNVAA